MCTQEFRRCAGVARRHALPKTDRCSGIVARHGHKDQTKPIGLALVRPGIGKNKTNLASDAVELPVGFMVIALLRSPRQQRTESPC